MNLNLHSGTPAAFVPDTLPGSPSLVDDMVLRHLKTPERIASVLHLREEIDLSVHAAAGRQFVELEKKETSAAWSSVSSLAAKQ